MNQLEVYTLRHIYLIDNKYSEGKFLGVFSSLEDLNNAIDRFIILPGFKDYPRECFVIKKFIVDNYDEWKNGFKEEELELFF